MGTSIAQLWIELDKDNTDTSEFVVWRAIKISPVSVLLVLYTFLLLWSLVGLSCFHCYLIFKGKTTREQLKANEEGGTRGLANCYRTMCSKMEPSLLPDFKVLYAEQNGHNTGHAPKQQNGSVEAPTSNGAHTQVSVDKSAEGTELATVTVEVAPSSRATTPGDGAAGIGTTATPAELSLPAATS